MVDFLYIAAAFQEISENPAKSDSVLLKLEITAGDIFQIDPSMLQALCEKLRNGVGLIECGRTEDLLPYGRSRGAKIENGCLSTIIEMPKGLNLGRHSYASTDGLIRACAHGIVRDFSIGLVDIICQCNICNEFLSSEEGGHCEHLPGQECENGVVPTYTIKEGRPLFISAEPFSLTEYENIQLLREDWGLDRAALMEVLSQIGELGKVGGINELPGTSLIVTKSYPGAPRRRRKLGGRYRSGS